MASLLPGTAGIIAPEVVTVSARPVELALARITGAPLLARVAVVSAKFAIAQVLFESGMYGIFSNVEVIDYCPNCLAKAVDEHIRIARQLILENGTPLVVQPFLLTEIAVRMIAIELFGNMRISEIIIIELD